MKKQLIFTLLIILSSCKSNKEEKKEPLQTEVNKEIVEMDEYMKALLEGLENFWEVEAPNGGKILVNMDKIFVIKENPTAVDTSARYFLHVKLQTGELINMDFNYKDHVLKSKQDSEFKNYALASRELPLDPIFSILIGQFDENGRLWQKILHEQNFY